MAEEAENIGGGEESPQAEETKCPECPPGLPGWMATFSDLVTLLLTFFVLLLSFAKTETAKYEAALGSIRDAFGGNVLKHGEVIQRGKSPDDSPTMIDSQEPVRPFPIDFLTMEGILDKHEINRESDEELKTMKNDLYEYNLSDSVNIYEMPEGIKVKVKDKILFRYGSLRIANEQVSIEVYTRLVRLLTNKDWSVFVQGYSSRGEVSTEDGKNMDAFELSAARASAVTRSLIRRGVKPDQISTVFYGDIRPENIPGRSQTEIERASRRVDFILRKRDLNTEGHKVDAR
ncbi:putative sodium-driven polar flagellar protein [Halobacteriovorax marinus SJ]|uniref:Sodium-driven polar flagellar protein n=1 Tax=Halobacteriovorax marinus (strain ATCC BAA-682 / DSM 15412 / SJ) TaxID=862908 RepID=E1WXG1_HALMS|nr:flagellar motor protein MotB [Halobacteriovorax marinus]CBW27478.1 putative sodium-driven polar flagellar protein [Halobacteriovorax marinus SJ]